MNMTARIQELEEQIRYHSDLYFNEHAPVITDAEFDALVDELAALDPTNAVLDEVGAIPSYGRKTTHATPMGSLEKTKTADGVDEWARKYTTRTDQVPQLVLFPKMDGVALRLNYEDGRLVEAATRGNHFIGQDVTDNVRAMACIPNALPTKVTCEVRGEGFMRKSVFNRLNDALRREGKNPFANPRNAASGSICCQDPKETASRELDFRWYDVISDTDFVEPSERRKLAWGAVNLPGLKPVYAEWISVEEFAAKAVYREARRPDLDFEIDGLVVALVSLDDQEDAGWTGGHPNGKLAFKFKPEQAKTIVRAIDVQVGRTGVLTPMCRVEPVYLAGSTISNITLHNMARVRELNIDVGDEILIEKGGDIIPGVVRVTNRHDRPETYWLPPEQCPSCGSPACLRENEVHLWCFNPACPGKLEARVEHWLKTQEILGIGLAAIKALCGAGLVSDISDLYYLSAEKASRALSGQTISVRLVESILEKNQIPLWQFIAGLGISNVGPATAKTLAKEYKTLDTIVALKDVYGTDADGYARLCALGDIGSITANNITKGVRVFEATIDAIRQVVEVQDVVEATGPLAGKSFLVTGTLSLPRKKIQAKIEREGGQVKGSVSKTLDFLVVGEKPGSKLTKAQNLGIKVLTEEELREMIVRQD